MTTDYGLVWFDRHFCHLHESIFVFQTFVSVDLHCVEHSGSPFFTSIFSINSLLLRQSEKYIISFAILYKNKKWTAIFKILTLELNRFTNQIIESVSMIVISVLTRFTNTSDGINITFNTKWITNRFRHKFINFV